MNSILIRKETPEDEKLFMTSRMEVLAAVFPEAEPEELEEIAGQTEAYRAEGADCVTYFAFCGEEFAGCGSICFYRVLPVCHNVAGKKGFVMNMYTRPKYRRQGISYRILEHLIGEARERGIDYVHLDASRLGRFVYRKFGFEQAGDEMYLRLPL